MLLVDTHAHLYLPQFDEDQDDMMQRAFDKGIKQIFLPNIDSSSIEAMLAFEAKYPDHCYAMMGLHPCSVKENYKEELAIVKEWLDRRSFCAVGEIGMDLYWDKTFIEEQKEAFKIQIAWAKEKNIPFVIHSREATEEILTILETINDPELRGIFHCFGGTVEQAERIIALGFYLGIGGVLTFKKAGLDKVLESVSLEHIVLETDSPYLAPTPFRGKRNESAYMHHVATKLASVKMKSIAEVAEITSRNAFEVFGRPVGSLYKLKTITEEKM